MENEILLDVAITVSFIPTASAKEADEGGYVSYHINLPCSRGGQNIDWRAACRVIWLKKHDSKRDKLDQPFARLQESDLGN